MAKRLEEWNALDRAALVEGVVADVSSAEGRALLKSECPSLL